jgi:peptidoglycan/LPS O-acetylase OafA/YrhL
MNSEATNRLAYIDALRGYAILGVIAVHASQAFPNLDKNIQLLANEGARGVQLFFVASALTLMMSWHHRNDGPVPFYIRRIFRIAPMFWLAMVFFLVAYGTGPNEGAPHGIGWLQVLLTASFLHGFYPEALSSIVPGGWSIAAEMTFYAVFPLLAMSIRSWKIAAIALVAALIGASRIYPYVPQLFAVLMPGQDPDLTQSLAYLWFFNQSPAFMAGILVYHLLHTFPGRVPRRLLQAGLVVSIAIMIANPFTTMVFRGPIGLLYAVLNIQVIMQYSLAFALFAFCLAQLPESPLINPVIRYVGKISYSAYLWHFAVLFLWSRFGSDLSALPYPALCFFVAYIALVLTTAVAATVTYRLVEAPFIRIGGVAASAVRGKDRQSIADSPALRASSEPA